MEDKLFAFYHGVILEHNRAPHFFEKRPGAHHVVEAYNPLCGDKFKLYFDLQDGKIIRATFHGYGCAVSKASASVLMTKIQGKSVSETREIVAAFLSVVKTGAHPPAADPETAAFMPARDFAGRLQCATLAWDTLAEFLGKKE